VDVIDLGMIEVTWPGEAPKKQHKCRIRYIGEEQDDGGSPKWLTTQRFTVSLHEKASLRRYLEDWRGVKFTETELRRFDLESLIGAAAWVKVSHETNATGDRTYARIDSCSRMPKFDPATGDAAPQPPSLEMIDYVREQDRDEYEVEPEVAPDVRGSSASAEAMAEPEPPPTTPAQRKQLVADQRAAQAAAVAAVQDEALPF
jgi:hypothetical protein